MKTLFMLSLVALMCTCTLHAEKEHHHGRIKPLLVSSISDDRDKLRGDSTLWSFLFYFQFDGDTLTLMTGNGDTLAKTLPITTSQGNGCANVRVSGYRDLGNVYLYLSEFRRYTTIPIDIRSGDSLIMLISANGGRANRLTMNLRDSRYFLVNYSKELDTLAAFPSEGYVTCQ
jgi:hypothetical protein